MNYSLQAVTYEQMNRRTPVQTISEEYTNTLITEILHEICGGQIISRFIETDKHLAGWMNETCDVLASFVRQSGFLPAITKNVAQCSKY